MSRFSPIDAALEGPRVVRREPWAVAYWVGVWAVAFIIIAVARGLTGSAGAAGGAPDDFAALIKRYGPLAALLIGAILVLWVMTTATVYRAVLRPGEHGWHLFKLGPDEARIGLLSLAETIVAAVLGGAPAYLLLVLVTPIFEALPSLSRLIAAGGFFATMAIDIWIAVRLSLAPVQTFATHRFPLSAYWGFARGHYWRLLAGYLIVAVEMLLVVVAISIVVGAFGGLAEAVIRWHDTGFIRRILLWLLVPVAAVLAGAIWVAPAILICAYQAYAYRAIVGAPPEPAPT